MWTVIGAVNNDEQAKAEAEGTHAFLILSHEDSTMVSIKISYYSCLNRNFYNSSFFFDIRSYKPDKKSTK